MSNKALIFAAVFSLAAGFGLVYGLGPAAQWFVH